MWFAGFLIVLLATFKWLKTTFNLNDQGANTFIALPLSAAVHERPADINRLKKVDFSAQRQGRPFFFEPSTIINAEEKTEALRKIRLHNILRRQTQVRVNPIEFQQNNDNDNGQFNRQTDKSNNSYEISQNFTNQEHNNNLINSNRFQLDSDSAKINQASNLDIIQYRVNQWEKAFKDR